MNDLTNMASIFVVDIDKVPVYTQYFDISLIPSTIFFFNGQHMKVDWGWVFYILSVPLSCLVENKPLYVLFWIYHTSLKKMSRLTQKECSTLCLASRREESQGILRCLEHTTVISQLISEAKKEGQKKSGCNIDGY